MRPPAWSYSGLDTFSTCARKFWAEKVVKTVPDMPTAAKAAGIRAHKAFEDRLDQGAAAAPLPADLAHHETLMQEIEEGPGRIYTERKVGLTSKLKPCGFFDKDVWWRGVLDVHKVKPDGTSLIVDYKNGKQHNKMRQLWLFGLYGFIEGQEMVESFYYWIQTSTRTRIKMPAAQAPMILRSLVPDLTAYKEAYDTDIWRPTRNGLCKNYCGVTECEFHGKGMTERV